MSELRAHLAEGLAEIRKTSATKIQAATSDRDALAARLGADNKHFAGALAESMTEVTKVGTRYNARSDSENGE